MHFKTHLRTTLKGKTTAAQLQTSKVQLATAVWGQTHHSATLPAAARLMANIMLITSQQQQQGMQEEVLGGQQADLPVWENDGNYKAGLSWPTAGIQQQSL
jgi:hypothetical protein